ncbi:MAG: hypothetical protein PHT59_02475 [Candidatus Omnitrophica bacterium]|nr:hypothetical protein [Candidatus Omnitrophota bacterium]
MKQKNIGTIIGTIVLAAIILVAALLALRHFEKQAVMKQQPGVQSSPAQDEALDPAKAPDRPAEFDDSFPTENGTFLQ